MKGLWVSLGGALEEGGFGGWGGGMFGGGLEFERRGGGLWNTHCQPPCCLQRVESLLFPFVFSFLFFFFFIIFPFFSHTFLLFF